MMESENNSFTNISAFFEVIVADHGICDHDLRERDKNNSITFAFVFHH